MTPAGTSNELDVQNGWEENTHTHKVGFPTVKETNFFAFYELDVEEKVIFENSLRRKLEHGHFHGVFGF